MTSPNVRHITIANDIIVTVPDSLQYLSTFVLEEQHDWFEDEIAFLRKFARPGMKIIDIGANFGVYTLSLAKIIGETGKIWAFEPTRFTADCLNKSISLNKFSNVKLIQAGLSDKTGKATFYTSPNSELNTLSKQSAAGMTTETITLHTLDQCRQNYGWKNIDFIKLDAEGEEANILKGGKNFLTASSPLIMFELKHGPNINLPLVNRFNGMGYNCYRLIPGLNILIPFDHQQPFDNSLLNLFCCKDDRAQILEQEGFLVRNWTQKYSHHRDLPEKYISGLAYSAALKAQAAGSARIDHDAYLEILSTYLLSLDMETTSADRVSHLMGALHAMRSMLDKSALYPERLASFSRIAFDAGERMLGINILTELINRYFDRLDFEIHEIFLPAAQRYEQIDPGSKLKEWLFSSILEQSIIKHAYSSYFSQLATLPAFEKLSTLGFFGKDMQLRHQLIKSCYTRA